MSDLSNDPTLLALISPQNLQTLWSVWLQYAPQEAQVGVDAAKEREEQWACYPWPPVLEVVTSGLVTSWEIGDPPVGTQRENLCLVWAECPELQVAYREEISTELAEFLAENIQPPKPYKNWTDVACGIHDAGELFDNLDPDRDMPMLANTYQPAVAVGDGAYDRFAAHIMTPNLFGGLGNLVEPEVARTDGTYDNYVANLQEQQDIPDATRQRIQLQASIRPPVNVGDMPVMFLTPGVRALDDVIDMPENGGAVLDGQLASLWASTDPTEATEVGLPEAPDQHHQLAELEDLWVTGAAAELLSQLRRGMGTVAQEPMATLDQTIEAALQPIIWDAPVPENTVEGAARNMQRTVDEEWMTRLIEELSDTDTDIAPL